MRTAFLVGIVTERHHRMPGHPLLHELPAEGHPELLRRVPGNLWHNDNCSGSFLPVHRRMKYLGPTSRPRLNEAVAVIHFLQGCFLLISLVSCHPFDPSWNATTFCGQAHQFDGAARKRSRRLLAAGVRVCGVCHPPCLILALGWNWVQLVTDSGAVGEGGRGPRCWWGRLARRSGSGRTGIRFRTLLAAGGVVGVSPGGQSGGRSMNLTGCGDVHWGLLDSGTVSGFDV